MKKILLCASIIALAASCTEHEFDSIQTPEAAKGISFETVAPQTRGEYGYDATEGYSWKWYAEKDQFDVYAINVLDGATKWSDEVTPAKYKATRSESRGLFTAVGAYPLEFKDDKEAEFVIVYPAGNTMSEVVDLTADGKDKNLDKKGSIAEATFTLPSLAGQAMNDVNDPSSRLVRYQKTFAKKEAWYESVGDKVELSLISANTMARFNIKNLKEYSYKKDAEVTVFGNLASISMTTKGYFVKKADTKNIKATPINWGGEGSKLTIDFTDRTKNEITAGAGAIVEDTEAGTSASTVSVAVGQPWADADYAFMAINNVNRKPFADKKVKETIVVTYNFENISFVQELTTDKNWPSEAGTFVPVPALDIDSYDYLVVNAAQEKKTLIVNKGTLAQVFKVNEDKSLDYTKVMWEGEEVAANLFTTIYINGNLDDDDLVLLNYFTAATDITLYDETSIVKDTFKDLAGLKSINFPKVTAIDKAAFNTKFASSSEDDAEVGLENVLLPSFVFNNAAAKDALLKATTLVTLDMSAVTSMGDMFPDAGFTLTNFKKLETVTVGDELLLGGAAFSGCTSLDEVIGGPVTIKGSNVFDGCTALATSMVLPTDKNKKGYLTAKFIDGVIPASTFKGCKALKYVLEDTPTGNSQFVPTAVMGNAFEGSGLVSMNLSKATTIGVAAFKDCANLVGVSTYNGKKNVLQVAAAKIPAEAFMGCKSVAYAYFPEATEAGKDFMNVNSVPAGNGEGRVYAAAALKEVKFTKVFTPKTWGGAEFGAPAEAGNALPVKLYINALQEGAAGSVFTYGEDKNGNALTITFANIIVE